MAASTKPMILAILANGEIYGYQIIQNVIEISGGTLEVECPQSAFQGMGSFPCLRLKEKEKKIGATNV